MLAPISEMAGWLRSSVHSSSRPESIHQVMWLKVLVVLPCWAGWLRWQHFCSAQEQCNTGCGCQVGECFAKGAVLPCSLKRFALLGHKYHSICYRISYLAVMQYIIYCITANLTAWQKDWQNSVSPDMKKLSESLIDSSLKHNSCLGIAMQLHKHCVTSQSVTNLAKLSSLAQLSA
jgi:hypothetical protein